MDDAARVLARDLREGDVLLTLGAGDIDSLAGRLIS
jgi:UDP-N-acetylmuramate-alanine ligase